MNFALRCARTCHTFCAPSVGFDLAASFCAPSVGLWQARVLVSRRPNTRWRQDDIRDGIALPGCKAKVVFEPIKELHNICLTQLQDTPHDHANTTNRSANRFACWRGRMKYKSPTYEKCSTIVPTGTVICHSTSYDCVITSYLPTCMTKNCMAGS